MRSEDKPHRFMPSRKDDDTCTWCGGSKLRRYQNDHTFDGGRSGYITVRKGDLMHAKRD